GGVGGAVRQPRPDGADAVLLSQLRRDRALYVAHPPRPAAVAGVPRRHAGGDRLLLPGLRAVPDLPRCAAASGPRLRVQAHAPGLSAPILKPARARRRPSPRAPPVWLS